jgi:hypothetical protein
MVKSMDLDVRMKLVMVLLESIVPIDVIQDMLWLGRHPFSVMDLVMKTRQDLFLKMHLNVFPFDVLQ